MSASARLPRMDAALCKPMTREEFFTWAEAQDGRYEFDGFRPVAMPGGTNNYGAIVGNILVQLRNRLRGSSCTAMGSSGGGIETAGGKIRYPQGTITCTPVPGHSRILPNPVVIFEVLSPSPRHSDTDLKLDEYRALPTMQRYILIEEIAILVTVHARQEDGSWATSELCEGAILDLPEVGISIPLEEIYDEIVFDDAPGQ